MSSSHSMHRLVAGWCPLGLALQSPLPLPLLPPLLSLAGSHTWQCGAAASADESIASSRAKLIGASDLAGARVARERRVAETRGAKRVAAREEARRVELAECVRAHGAGRRWRRRRRVRRRHG